MTHHRVLGPRHAGVAFATLASLGAAALAAGTSYASGGPAAKGHEHLHGRAALVAASDRGYVDVTDGTRGVTPALLHAVKAEHARAAGARARAAVPGPSGIVREISASTGTVRFTANLDGVLSGPSSDTPRHIALQYVRDNAADLGLTTADIATFRLARDYRDITGTHHLYFTQRIAGGSVARNGLTAALDRDGQLLMVGGMPVRTATAASLPATSALTITTPAAALARTRGTVAPGTDTSDDTARRVVFDTGTDLRPAWETVVTSSETPATTVIDAVTGETLLRTPLTHDEHATGRAYQFFPGAARGGRQISVDFTRLHWLSPSATTLAGNNAHAFSDVDDNDRSSRTEEVHPLRAHSWGYRLTPFHLGFARGFCGNPWPCSWNPDRANSWKTNRAQNATQVFYFVNNWHDHLRRAPIGFTEAAGNFQLTNGSGRGKGGDPVIVQTDDGANTGQGSLRGLPNPSHIDNANMTTPPDGHRPTMQMYLQHEPFTAYPGGDPFAPTNVGDEADTVYHEYTHGLSARLVVDVHGRSTLGKDQAGAMGEAWSDWYAMDYLVDRGFQADKPGRADVRLFVYDGKGVNYDRTEPLDCKVGQQARLCGGASSGHTGGYTYADYARVIGGPEVHADGEIWGQTLWDLRDRLGSRRSEMLVTRAMELAPYNPSFLDMRNAILVADNARYAGADLAAIWEVFAHRGMGFYAGSLGGNDTTPAASFDLPPTTGALGTVSGTVTHHGVPQKGITVTLAFQGSGVVNPTAVTDANGQYTLPVQVPQGHYLKALATGGGLHQRKAVTVGAGTTTLDFTP